jgi:two-component system phosphate regulon response regulator PhoB
MARILVVEDDHDIADLLVHYLRKAGHTVSCLTSGADVLPHLRTSPADLVILDWMLPGLSGMAVCEALRHDTSTLHVPIIMLTARGDEADRVAGLERGADDYVTKPFSPSELMARAKAALRRARPQSGEENLSYADLEMDLATHRVRRGSRDLHLGPTEFRLLKFLMENQGRVFSREQLLDHVWGRDIYVEPRTVDVHIRRLRKAINIDGLPDLIRTVRSAGYALDIED